MQGKVPNKLFLSYYSITIYHTESPLIKLDGNTRFSVRYIVNTRTYSTLLQIQIDLIRSAAVLPIGADMVYLLRRQRLEGVLLRKYHIRNIFKDRRYAFTQFCYSHFLKMFASRMRMNRPFRMVSSKFSSKSDLNFTRIPIAFYENVWKKSNILYITYIVVGCVLIEVVYGSVTTAVWDGYNQGVCIQLLKFTSITNMKNLYGIFCELM